jgi:hypothetical protein
MPDEQLLGDSQMASVLMSLSYSDLFNLANRPFSTLWTSSNHSLALKTEKSNVEVDFCRFHLIRPTIQHLLVKRLPDVTSAYANEHAAATPSYREKG